MYSLTVLEARNAKARFWQGWFLPGAILQGSLLGLSPGLVDVRLLPRSMSVSELPRVLRTWQVRTPTYKCEENTVQPKAPSFIRHHIKSTDLPARLHLTRVSQSLSLSSVGIHHSILLVSWSALLHSCFPLPPKTPVDSSHLA